MRPIFALRAWLRRITGKPPIKGKYPTYKKKKPTTRGGKSSKRAQSSWLRFQIKRWLRIGLIVGALAFITFWFTLPSIDKLASFEKKPSILMKSEDGQVIGSSGDVYGRYVKFDELPKSLVDAVIATEDRNFYYHPGIDPLGLLRASIANFRAGHVVQGGSTITQQVAKNVFLTPERSMLRKVREMFLAFKLEWKFTKKEIMAIYLNRVYLGAGNYGVDAASHRYFDKPATEMTLGESAILAGMLKAPSRFAPTNNPKLSQKRAEQVIVNMADAKFITKEKALKAREQMPSALSGHKNLASSNLYFGDWVLEQIPEYVGTPEEDIIVTTTLRPDLQTLGEKSMHEVMDKDGEKLNASQSALVSMTPDGAVRAMIGGMSYGESQYNRATQALRQPGSSFKLFVYLAGLEAGFTPDSIVTDEEVSIGKWHPSNYDGKYLGEMPLRQAVARSINTVAIQVSQQAGLWRVINMAKQLGISEHIEPVPSIALGAVESTLIEMTGAYAHMASDGKKVEPFGIIEIRTGKGEILYARKDEDRAQILRPDIVGMMNDLLSGVIQYGTGAKANIGRSAAGKTGTTSDYRDAWFIGYTPDLVTGVWVGNDNNTPMKKVTGGTLPAPIWQLYMKTALSGTPARSLPIRGAAPMPWQETISHAEPMGKKPAEDNGVQFNDQGEPVQPKKHDDDDVELSDEFWKKLQQAAPE